MSKNKPATTLFMLSSLDGKISTGITDARDMDKDFPTIPGIKEGLQQYYAIEKTTDVCSFISARVLAKIGINKKQTITQILVSFVVVDNHGHLTKTGVQNMIDRSKKLYLITTNKKHVAFEFQNNNKLKIIYYSKKINFSKLFETLKQTFNINRLTIQSGGSLNAELLRAGLIDRISLVIAPALVGGKNTPTLIDGPDIKTINDLQNIRPLTLSKINKLKHSYLHLIYHVQN